MVVQLLFVCQMGTIVNDIELQQWRRKLLHKKEIDLMDFFEQRNQSICLIIGCTIQSSFVVVNG